MAEYIEREAAVALLEEKLRDICPIGRCSRNAVYGTDRDLYDAIESDIDALNNIPAADVVEVVHGKWVDHMVRDWRCSVCGEKINKIRNVDGYCYEDKPHYCPNCGARMDGDG